MKKAIRGAMIGIIIVLISLIIYGAILIIINFRDGKKEIDNNIDGWKSLDKQVEEQYKYH